MTKFADVHREKSVDARKHFAKSETENSPKFNGGQKQPMLIPVLYMYKTDYVPYTYNERTWEYCFFYVHSV